MEDCQLIATIRTVASVAVSLTVVYTEFDDFTTRHTTDRELRLVRQAGLQHIAAGGGGVPVGILP